jgi:DsbC/DsbD-like thiol-disulfide interchange protein
LAAAGAAALVVLAAAQSARPAASVAVTSKHVVRGQEFKARVTVDIPSGWHGYQNPPSQDYQIPVSVEGKGNAFRLLKAEYPAGTLEDAAGEKSMVYSGKVQIPVTFKAGTKVGRQTLTVKVSYQLCDAGSCLPPSSVEAKTTVNVVRKAPAGASGS